MRRLLLLALVALTLPAAASAHEVRVDLPNAWTPPCEEERDWKWRENCADFIGHQHRDRVDATRGEDFLYGLAGADVFVGRGAPDRMWGGRGDDRLEGGKGHDHLNGGPGDDVLDCGQTWGDMAHGGPGADTFINCEHVSDFDAGEGDRAWGVGTPP